MDQEKLHKTFDAFQELKVLVIGDVMLDAYYEGPTERISPEAPVPVVRVDQQEKRPGGAANVALNIRSLGARPIICSVIGDDQEGHEFRSLMEGNGSDTSGLIGSGTRRTTVKTRIISQGQQLMRVDEEDAHELSEEEEGLLMKRVSDILEEQTPDVLIFEDYNKGVLTEGMIRKTIGKAREKGVPTIVDPKWKQFFSYRDVTLFKPNLKELREALGVELPELDASSLKGASAALREKLSHRTTLITLSSKGIFVEGAQDEGQVIPAVLRNIADVSGAGDTVVSVAALCTALDSDPLFTAALANLAGGLVCEEVGVVPVDKEKLLREALSYTFPS